MVQGEMTQKRTLEEWQALAVEHPEKYSVKNGVVNDLQTKDGSRIIASFNQAKLTPLTPATSQQMHALRRARKNIANIKGRILAARKYLEDKEMPATIPDPGELTDEEIIAAEGDAEILYSYLFNLAFLKEADKIATGKGGNFRGLGEGYRTGRDAPEDPKQHTPGGNVVHATPAAIRELMQILDEEISARVEKSKALEGDYESIR